MHHFRNHLNCSCTKLAYRSWLYVCSATVSDSRSRWASHRCNFMASHLRKLLNVMSVPRDDVAEYDSLQVLHMQGSLLN